MDKGFEGGDPTMTPTTPTVLPPASAMGHQPVAHHGEVFEAPKTIESRHIDMPETSAGKDPVSLETGKGAAGKVLEKVREKGIDGGLEWLAFGQKTSPVQEEDIIEGQEPREKTVENASEQDTPFDKKNHQEDEKNQRQSVEEDPRVAHLEQEVKRLEQQVQHISQEMMQIKKDLAHLQKMSMEMAQMLIQLLKKELEREKNEKKRASLIELLLKVMEIITEELTKQPGGQQQTIKLELPQ